jgi:hypothetical protein
MGAAGREKGCWLQPAVVISLKCLVERDGLLNFEFLGNLIFHVGVNFVITDASLQPLVNEGRL